MCAAAAAAAATARTRRLDGSHLHVLHRIAVLSLDALGREAHRNQLVSDERQIKVEAIFYEPAAAVR